MAGNEHKAAERRPYLALRKRNRDPLPFCSAVRPLSSRHTDL